MGGGSLRSVVLSMVRPAGTEVPVSERSAAAERLVRGAGVLHAEPERRALLRCAEHVRRLDVDLAPAQAIRRLRESSRFVAEPDLDDLAVTRDAVLVLLDGAARLWGVLVVDDDV